MTAVGQFWGPPGLLTQERIVHDGSSCRQGS